MTEARLICGKIRYRSKASAKRARKEIGDSRLRAYKCSLCLGEPAWHLGHLPTRIIKGFTTRTEVYRRDAPQ